VALFSGTFKNQVEAICIDEETKHALLPKLVIGVSKVISDVYAKHLKDLLAVTAPTHQYFL